MRQWTIIVLSFLMTPMLASARAQGFAVTDLTPLGEPAASALGPGFEVRE
jgi:hypothetical protein